MARPSTRRTSRGCANTASDPLPSTFLGAGATATLLAGADATTSGSPEPPRPVGAERRRYGDEHGSQLTDLRGRPRAPLATAISSAVATGTVLGPAAESFRTIESLIGRTSGAGQRVAVASCQLAAFSAPTGLGR